MSLTLLACDGASVVSTKISGNIFHDQNNNGTFDATADEALSGFIVYADLNDNEQLDSNEPSTQTSSNGAYSLAVEPGSYNIRQALPFGWRNTSALEQSLAESLEISTTVDTFTFSVLAFFQNPEAQDTITCSGVLISDQWVLTAGHCFELLEISPDNMANLGAVLAYDGVSQPETIFGIEQAVLHPDIDLSSIVAFGTGAQPPADDLLLLKLDQPVNLIASGITTPDFTSAEPLQLDNPGTLTSLIGYGALSYIDARPGAIDFFDRKTVHMPLVEGQLCITPQDGLFDEEKQLCAGFAEGGANACFGDSGGPLVVKNADETGWVLAGIVSGSVGSGCGVAGEPSIHSRVSFYKDWIASTASEVSLAYPVTIKAGDNLVDINFGNLSTTNIETDLELDDRWQLTEVYTVDGSDSDFLFEWRIFDESSNKRNFECAFDLDGSVGGLESSAVDCDSNQLQQFLADSSGLGDGLYYPSFSVSFDGVTDTRHFFELSIGDIDEQIIDGALISSDDIDLAIGESIRYVDYFNLENIEPGQVVRVTASSPDMLLQLFVMDRDFWEETADVISALDASVVGFDGFRVSIDTSETLEVTFIAEEGIRYALGIRAADENATGEYQISIINGAEAEARQLVIPPGPRQPVLVP